MKENWEKVTMITIDDKLEALRYLVSTGVYDPPEYYSVHCTGDYKMNEGKFICRE